MDRIYEQKGTKSAKALRNQVRPELHLCFLRYLLLENKRFADDCALLFGVIRARHGDRRRVIRGEIISRFSHRGFANATAA
jgi:hypothetical protein